MKKVTSILMLVTLLAVSILSGCNSSSSTLANNDSTETSMAGIVEQTSEPTTEQTEDQVIYISGLSGSLKAVDEYSLTEDGDLIRDYYCFDFDTKIYTPENVRIEWRDFMDYVNHYSQTDNKRTKCRILSHNKYVKEAYLFR